ncbi:MAG: hypothetical protein ACOYJH_02990 [Anaerovoracaceae bacterium]|jgi:hypothetical protein
MAQQNEYVTGETKSGFKFKIDKRRLNDYELLEDLELLDDDETETSVITRIVNRFLGEEQAKRLKEHCRGEDGIIPILGENSMVATLGEIFTIVQEKDEDVKNS